MSKSLRLHKEHGVNPTISQCLYCGEDKNEIALLGAGHKEMAPMRMVLSLEPCDKCKDTVLKEGVARLEAGGTEGEPRPTGRLIVLKNEAFTRIFQQEPPQQKIVFLEEGVFKDFAKQCADSSD